MKADEAIDLDQMHGELRTLADVLAYLARNKAGGGIRASIDSYLVEWVSREIDHHLGQMAEVFTR